jgi:hypothetical protein
MEKCHLVLQIPVFPALVAIKMRFEGRDPKDIERFVLAARTPVGLCSPEQLKKMLEDIKKEKEKK